MMYQTEKTWAGYDTVTLCPLVTKYNLHAKSNTSETTCNDPNNVITILIRFFKSDNLNEKRCNI